MTDHSVALYILREAKAEIEITISTLEGDQDAQIDTDPKAWQGQLSLEKVTYDPFKSCDDWLRANYRHHSQFPREQLEMIHSAFMRGWELGEWTAAQCTCSVVAPEDHVCARHGRTPRYGSHHSGGGIRDGVVAVSDSEQG